MDRDGESRLRALGRLVEQRRVALGLRPGELASRARLRNSAAIGGGVVRAFEIAGKADLVTIVRLVEVLEIDAAAPSAGGAAGASASGAGAVVDAAELVDDDEEGEEGGD